MEYPKRINRSFAGEKPVKIIRASGEPGTGLGRPGNLKVKEYQLVKERGKMGFYK